MHHGQRPLGSSRLGHCSLLLPHIKRLVSCTFSPQTPSSCARASHTQLLSSLFLSSPLQLPRAAQSKARPSWLLSTTEQRSCQLANKVVRPTTALASVVLLSAAEEGARELADEVVRSAAAAAVALLVVTHESVHGKAAQRAVARLAVSAHAPGPVANISRSL